MDYEDYEDFEDYDGVENFTMSFLEEDILEIMEAIKPFNDLLKGCENEFLANVFKRENELNENGEYYLNEDIIDNLVNSVLGDGLRELSDKGIIDCLWDDDANDFVFKLPDNMEVE